jgi:hypothetical protein
MFQINSYLQHHTPNGKPRVLVEGVDYSFKNKHCLFQEAKGATLFVTFAFNVSFYKVANLSDCRPLLSVEVDGKVWTEGDICTHNQELFTQIGGSFNPARFVENYGFVVFDGYQMNFELYKKMFHLSNAKQNIGSFFDDPAQYSQILWNCSEEEGWEKVFKLLGVKK